MRQIITKMFLKLTSRVQLQIYIYIYPSRCLVLERTFSRLINLNLSICQYTNKRIIYSSGRRNINITGEGRRGKYIGEKLVSYHESFIILHSTKRIVIEYDSKHLAAMIISNKYVQ